MPHSTNEQGLKRAGSDSRLLFLSCSVFSVHTKYSAFVETKWFDYRKQRLSSCLYPHSTTCRYQISLHYIVRMLYLKKLLFELLAWVSHKTGQWILALDLHRISNNFWNSSKYTSAILYFVFLRSGILSTDDYKIKILINSIKCWRCTTSNSMKYSAKS